MKSTSENGRPAATETDCRAENPPENSSPSVMRPVAAAQKSRSQMGASSPDESPLLDRLASTSAPESAEVTKKIRPMMTETLDQMAGWA